MQRKCPGAKKNLFVRLMNAEMGGKFKFHALSVSLAYRLASSIELVDRLLN
jgi:hypothetical protein